MAFIGTIIRRQYKDKGNITSFIAREETIGRLFSPVEFYLPLIVLSLVHTSGIKIRIRTNKRQNKGMQSSLLHIERLKHKHNNLVEA